MIRKRDGQDDIKRIRGVLMKNNERLTKLKKLNMIGNSSLNTFRAAKEIGAQLLFQHRDLLVTEVGVREIFK